MRTTVGDDQYAIFQTVDQAMFVIYAPAPPPGQIPF